MRDREGRHSLDADAYRDAIAAIRRKRTGEELAIQITTESGGRYGREQQMAVVRELVPDAVSLAVREFVPSPEAEPDAAGFFAWLHRHAIAPQYILYSPAEVARFEDLLARDVIPGDGYWVLFVLGGSDGPNAEPADLLPYLEARKTDYSWAVCAFGRREAACALTAAGLGGHVRVGFENNFENARGHRARDNAELVAQIREGAALLGRPLARATALPR